MREKIKMTAEQDKKNAAFYYSVNMLRLLLRAELLTEAEYRKIVKLSAEHYGCERIIVDYKNCRYSTNFIRFEYT